jgi:hypothetical protein
MEAGLRTPLLDFFRRGEVARDVRMQAAQGAIAPRPLEQLGILMLLTSDPDGEIRQTAEATLAALPRETLAGYIARTDVPTELREFFVKRGIEPAAVPAPDDPGDAEDVDETGLGFGSGGEEAGGRQQTFTERLGTMTVPEKIKCAMKGTREMRSILIRDPNRIVSSAVLSCPKVNESEIEAYARMGNVSEDILRTIAMTRAWTKNYNITLSLVKNAKTPVALSLTLLQRLNDRDLKVLSTDRNVPEPLRVAARKKFVAVQK